MNIRPRLTTILAASLALAALALPAAAQTNPPPTPSGLADLGNTVVGYLTAFNTNYDGTFGNSTFDIWTGVSSIQGGDVPLANVFGVSYDIWHPNVATTTSPVRTALSLEGVLLDSGVAGALLSSQGGLGFSVIIHDAKLTAYLDGGYDLYGSGNFAHKVFGEVGVRAKKAISQHFYLGVGGGIRFPAQERLLEAFTGVTF